jgi:putative NIF3 family GTP cyclohydrolase 1 type 2
MEVIPGSRISRREFIALAAAGTMAAPAVAHARQASPAGALTAQEVVERIKQASGLAWATDTVDGFKAGDPLTVVTGIATTALATIPALRQAVEARANLIVTCEPTFYSRSDAQAPAPGRPGAPISSPDPVFAAKDDLVRRNGMIIWRFSDHWRQRRPDPLAIGLTDALGWSRFRAADDAARLVIPPISLESLASDIKEKLGARGGIRVVGDPTLTVETVGLLAGTTSVQAALRLMPRVDTILAGEVREWETVEYVRDKVTAGEKKSLILLGRVLSEDPGMNVCAEWLRNILPQIRTTWIPVSDPYWRPM